VLREGREREHEQRKAYLKEKVQQILMDDAFRASPRRGSLSVARQGHGSACPDLHDLTGDKFTTRLIRPPHLTGHVTERRGAGGLDFVGLGVLDLRAADAIALEHGIISLLFTSHLFVSREGWVGTKGERVMSCGWKSVLKSLLSFTLYSSSFSSSFSSFSSAFFFSRFPINVP
jgi:hypothetical protein